jgi:hypothetical protein
LSKEKTKSAKAKRKRPAPKEQIAADPQAKGDGKPHTAQQTSELADVPDAFAA